MNLNQVTIPSKDLSISVPFYKKLGLELIVDALPRYARFVCPEGQATFSIHYVDAVDSPGQVWIYFECDVDTKVAELSKLGIDVEEQPEDKSWLWREARLKDPDGNQIILYYAGENRVNPPWRVVNS